MNMPIHKLLLPSSGQSPERTTQPGAGASSPDLDRPDQSSSVSPRRTCTAQPRAREPSQSQSHRCSPGEAWSGGAVLSRSGLAARHVIFLRAEASQLQVSTST
ncbi:hypothetical protein SETIT_9G512900v2 [Setaria italica]|uniref:Uncharacterized protein n=1 Tax=Setaria italica TaxID=4555 RepID=A0A368SUT9_SETIT|nr:hypothetical protein SETIT_9G512900v2 [Setaria italica]